jgi:hypothetical protein
MVYYIFFIYPQWGAWEKNPAL